MLPAIIFFWLVIISYGEGNKRCNLLEPVGLTEFLGINKVGQEKMGFALLPSESWQEAQFLSTFQTIDLNLKCLFTCDYKSNL